MENIQMRESSKQYRSDFQLDGDSSTAKEAFKIAVDTRKFEIGLYWQRTAYFWALIVSAFGGYLAVLSTSIPDKSFYAFVVACVGFVFSVAWYLVNRGSKFWQENWENHVDLLSDNVAGPIFKTILCRSSEGASHSRASENIIGPLPISVSKVNQWVSVFACAIWTVLICSAGPNLRVLDATLLKYGAVLLISVFFTFLLLTQTRTHLHEHRHKRIVKESFIVDD